MPAIPVYARLECTFSDDELKAIHQLTRHIVLAAYNGEQSLFQDASQGDAALWGHMIRAVCDWHDASARALRERNLTA
ncbi:hypothetical protein [Achromobacter sp. UMC71]|uniref:hypothetical protein n=1 Tax=Achromobacter sp. UMC71 TaxID=1862320 RepID=UPI0016044DF4|nr:hypothetical protein [Achromobacter sp. UMC71]MBB1625194.1 hypothetical protein [Achromobacter sp. UMC71]